MFGKALFAIIATAALAGAANAHSISVLGGNADAVACFRSANSEAPRPDALAACDAALRSNELDNHDLIATLVNRGIVRFRLGDFNDAIADFDRALAIEPRQAEAMINRGITMLAAGHDIDQSAAFIERGLAAGPERPWVGYYARAVANELAGRDAAAYRDYKRAGELRPGWSLPREALARFSVRG